MLSVKKLKKGYKLKKNERFMALDDINLDFPNKGFVFIIGKSGSGKSTLLNILGGLDKFDSGEIIVKGKSSEDFKTKDFDSYRNTYLGFVFQAFNLVEGYTLGKNISLALELQSMKNKTEKEARVDEILESVELLDKKHNKIHELSGGQKQRVAIARALVKNPEIIIADEPTGNLDSATSKMVMDTLRKLADEKLVIMVTHDVDYAAEYADRVIELSDGKVIKDETSKYRSETPIMNVEGTTSTKKVIRVPKSRRIDMTVMDQVNDVVTSNSDKDIYVSLTFDKKVATQLEPAAKELTEVKTEIKEIKMDYSKKDDFKLIKSKLPLADSMKMGFGNVWRKKFRLIFTFILMIISLSLFGMSDVFASFNYGTSVSHTYNDLGYQSLQIDALDRRTGQISLFNNELFTEFEEDFKSSNFVKSYDIEDYDGGSVENGYIAEEFFTYYGESKSITLHDSDKSNLDILEEDTSISNTNSIYISDYYAEILKKENNLSDVLDVLGETENGFIIKGIYKTTYERYQTVHERLYASLPKTDESYKELPQETNDKDIASLMNSYEDFHGVKSYYYHFLTFEETTVSENSLFTVYDTTSYRGVTTKLSNSSNEDGQSRLSFTTEIEFYTDIVDNPTATETRELKDNEVVTVIQGDYIENTIGSNITITQENDLDGDLIANETFTVVGHVKEEDYIKKYNLSNYDSKAILSSSQKENFVYNAIDEGISTDNFNALLLLSDNLSDNANSLNAIKNAGYFIDMQGSALHSTVLIFSLIIEGITDVFKNITIFTIGLTIFLIFNSISASVVKQKKDIGTFRAIGARGFDVAKIFIIEALIIALISGFVALIAVSYTTGKINGVLGEILPFDMAIFNILTVLKILGLSIASSLLAALIPVKAVSTMSPIDAIRNA